MKKEILNYILKLLEEKNKIDKKSKLNINNFEYLYSGHIDSLQLVHLILRIEKKFNIEFSVKEKESAKFRTVGGLTEIIKKKLN